MAEVQAVIKLPWWVILAWAVFFTATEEVFHPIPWRIYGTLTAFGGLVGLTLAYWGEED